MKKTTYVCDLCGASGALSVALHVGRSSDGSGMANDYKTVDLCHKCSIACLKHIANHRNVHFDVVNELVGRIQEKRR